MIGAGPMEDKCQCSGESDACSTEKCDIFDFMARHVGMTVIHPGGFRATRELMETLQLTPGSRVLDIACGKGTSAFLLAERYGCSVVGIDIAEDLIDEARDAARRRGLDDRVRFQVGDALDLPFARGEFDATVSQAMLVLVGDQERSIREALRVAKTGGRSGWLELAWRKPPSQEFMQGVTSVICAYCMLNVHTIPEWKDVFARAGAGNVGVIESPLGFSGMRDTIADEGLGNALRMMLRTATNGRIRRRMKKTRRFFADNAEIFGYGVFTVTKAA